MKILIVEDDKDIAEMVRSGLAAHNHAVEVAPDGADGSFMARSYDYDAIVLDYSLPKKNGLAVCKEVRVAGKKTPIIFLSGTEEVETKVAALEQGADDYMTKPFSLVELHARLRAVSRRPRDMTQSILCVGDLELNTETQTVKRDGITIGLTRKEFNLLEYFMQHPGVVLSRTMLMEHVWTAERDPFSNTVEAHIANLRRKINLKNKMNLIVNIAGRGYRIGDEVKKK